MVKGVSKQIIEVNNTESIYFERAVFYLRPGVRKLPTEISSREIDRYIAENGLNDRKRRSLKLGTRLIYFFIIITLAAVIFVIK